MTTTNDKIRGVFLSALLVMSVFAGAAAFAGTAAANHASNGEDLDSNSETIVYQGQTAVATGYNASETEIPLYDDEGEFQKHYKADGAGHVNISTSNLQGIYYVGAKGHTSSTSGNEDFQFQVVKQTFNVDTDEVSLSTDSGNLTIDIDDEANRDDFSINVSTADADAGLINGSADTENTQTTADEHGYVTSVSAGDEGVDIPLNNEISTGNYTVNVNVTDTTASDTVDAEVSESSGADVNLPSDVVENQRGDIVSFTVDLENTGSSYVQVGSSSSNFMTNFTVEDGNNDGEVTVMYNTYNTMGESDVTNIAYTSSQNDDSVTTNGQQGVYNYSDGPTKVAADQYGLDAPMASGNYDITAAVNNDDRDDKTRLRLTDASVDAVSTWVYPGGSLPDSDEQAELLDGVSESSTIANQDSVIVEVEASGIHGYISSVSDFGAADASTTGTDHVYLNVTQSDTGPNANAKSFDASSAEKVWFDANNDTIYFGFDTASTSEISADDEFTADFHIAEDNNVSDSQNASADFGVEAPSISFNGMNADEVVEIGNSGNATVTANTNLAPGTSVSVDIESTDQLFTNSTTVDGDGMITAEFDLSELENDTEVSLLADAPSVSQDADGIIVEAEDEPEDTETTTEETTEETTTEETTTEETTTEETTEDMTTEETTMDDTTEDNEDDNDGGIPGFGMAISLVALVAAALLALRRSN